MGPVSDRPLSTGYTENQILGSAVETMKIIILGKSNIGKTALTRRFVHNDFTSMESTTIGAAFGAKRVTVNGKPIVMGIWDTAGSERYESMSRIYYRGAKAAIICYDITQRSTFQRVRFWVQELQKNESDCKIYLCGTKKDLLEQDPKSRQVDFHDATDFADEIHAKLFETSSKTGENIANLFTVIAEEYVSESKRLEFAKSGSTVNLKSSSPHNRGCKC